MLHELFLIIGGLDFKDGHCETLWKNNECAVVKLLISNEHLTLELELNIDCATKGGITLWVNYDRGS